MPPRSAESSTSLYESSMACAVSWIPGLRAGCCSSSCRTWFNLGRRDWISRGMCAPPTCGHGSAVRSHPWEPVPFSTWELSVEAMRECLSEAGVGPSEGLTTPYVAFCDGNTWWEPGARGGPVGHPPAPGGDHRAPGRRTLGWGEPAHPGTAELARPGPRGAPAPAILGDLAGVSVLRAEAFRGAGGFSERLWLGGEEELLVPELASAGWWLGWDERAVAHHHASERTIPVGAGGRRSATPCGPHGCAARGRAPSTTSGKYWDRRPRTARALRPWRRP